MEEIKGVLFGRGEFDWEAGGNSPIQRAILMPDKNWKKIELEHEIQFNYPALYDTLFCVTYSNLKAIAKLLTYLESIGRFTPIQLAVLNKYKKNGKYNFSERFTGTLGGTTNQGAYQFKIAQAIRNYGLIPQDMFPLADNFQDNIDPKFITQEMYDCGKEILDIIAINYEWVDSIDYLQYSPIPLIVRFANYEKPEDILAPEGATNHQVCGVLATPEYTEIEDTYQQRYKRYRPDKTFHLMAFYITILTNNHIDTTKWLEENNNKIIRNQNTGAYGVVYHNNPLLILPERAGLFMIDRDARGLIGKGKIVTITNNEWEQLSWVNF